MRFINLAASLALALSLGFVSVANADTTTEVKEFTTSFDTSAENAPKWLVSGAITPTNFNYESDKSLNKSYVDALTADDYSTARSVSYESAAGWTDGGAGWITGAEEAKGVLAPNSFSVYAFVFDMVIEKGFSDAAWASFSATLNSDDFVVAIYLNGDLVADTDETQKGSNWVTGTTVTFSTDISGVELKNESNVLQLVVLNNHTTGKEGDNATGLNASFEIKSNAKIVINDEPIIPNTTATPEPATLLILGVGVAGAALARRRKQQA